MTDDYQCSCSNRAMWPACQKFDECLIRGKLNYGVIIPESKKKVIKYNIICRKVPSELIIVANQLLSEGWETLGAPFVDHPNIYQAMVKYEN